MDHETLLARLRDWGCDVDRALERLLGDADFFCECLQIIVQEPGFDRLGECLRAEDAKQGFVEAHTLKGVLGNLNLDPMYHTVCALVEPLRAGNAEGLMPQYETLMTQKAQLEQLVAECQ